MSPVTRRGALSLIPAAASLAVPVSAAAAPPLSDDKLFALHRKAQALWLIAAEADKRVGEANAALRQSLPLVLRDSAEGKAALSALGMPALIAARGAAFEAYGQAYRRMMDEPCHTMAGVLFKLRDRAPDDDKWMQAAIADLVRTAGEA